MINELILSAGLAACIGWGWLNHKIAQWSARREAARDDSHA